MEYGLEIFFSSIFYCLVLSLINDLYIDNMGIVPFVTSHPMGRFFVYFTVDFLLFLAPARGPNPVGPIT